ncbi:hypothetical protein Cgig2_012912 [Carnegiea gigantea]|uniref:Uncharacterized protein n=1 Tax=Carnegiea gigantea TaxID=171969 RepID=A0A9Q1JLX9_9CARY|nr:hypothetical protein Cgig2_012912 [Carnegiea gigantea]
MASAGTNPRSQLELGRGGEDAGSGAQWQPLVRRGSVNPETERTNGRTKERLGYEGTALKYVPFQEANGHRYAKTKKEDIRSEVEYWSMVVICGVMGPNPPVEVINGYVHRIWANRSIDKVVLARRGVYLSGSPTSRTNEKCILQRKALWEDIRELANRMNVAWCIQGDFNVVLHPEDRIGGDEIQTQEIQDFMECLEDCELATVRSARVFYT